MLTSREPNDPSSPRIAFHRPRFLAAEPPDPGRDDWTQWEALMASDQRAPGDEATGAMCFSLDSGFATVSSSLIALPAIGRTGVRPRFRFAAGPPDRTPFRDLPWR